MAKKANSRERIRMVSSYEEEMKMPLSGPELADIKERIVEKVAILRDTKLSVGEEKKKLNKSITDIQNEITKLSHVYEAKARSQRVFIEEWLKGDNEIEIVNSLTGEVIETRTAEPHELQESLFTGPAPAPDAPASDPGFEPFGAS